MPLTRPTVKCRGKAKEELPTKPRILVKASPTEEFVSDAKHQVEIITRENLESSGAKDISDALESHPGIDIRSDTLRSSLEVRLQGLNKEHVLFLINGKRIIGTFDGAIDLSRIKAEEVERIEIYKGSSSAVFGSGAIAGAINIITRKATKEFSLDYEAYLWKRRGPLLF